MKSQQLEPRSPALRARTKPWSEAWALRRPALIALVLVATSLGSGALTPGLAADEEATPAAAAAAAALPEAERERQAEAIARSIMSPFCPGRTVSACPNAGPWRDDIRKWVGEGLDATEIKRRLAERVPEHNLAGVPKNRLGWVLPVGLGIGALGFLVFLLRYLIGSRGSSSPTLDVEPTLGTAARGKGKNASPAGGKTSPDDMDARLDQELETFEQ